MPSSREDFKSDNWNRCTTFDISKFWISQSIIEVHIISRYRYINVYHFCICRCKIPNLLNDSYAIQSQQHKDLINATIPILPDGSYDECKITVNGTLETCSEWVYDQSVFTRTVNSQVNKFFSRRVILVCPLWKMGADCFAPVGRPVAL